MSATGSWVTQAAIVAALRADSTLMTMVPGGVLDHVPQGTQAPCIVVGEGEETDASSFGQVGHRIVPAIQVWTRDGEATNGTGSAGYKAALAIADRVVEILMDDAFTVDGHDVIVADLEEVSKERPDETDPSLRLVTPRVLMYLEDNPSA